MPKIRSVFCNERGVKEGWVFTFIAMGIVSLIAAVAIVAQIAHGVSCNAYETHTGRKTFFDFIGGCYVKTDGGRWIPRDTYETMHIEGLDR